jgi:hypothetical protein
VFITARDTETDQVLRVEASVGRIASIQIINTREQLNVESTDPLKILAFNDKRAAFSTVQGLMFQWEAENQGAGALKIVAMTETAYKGSEGLRDIESKHQHSDVAMVKGVRTGKANVSAKLLERGYEEVAPATVAIQVIEPFILKPQHPVYVLPNSKFPFSVFRVREDRETQVTLPSREFQFSVSDEAIGEIDSSALVESKDQLGRLTVKARDVTVENNEKTGWVHVVAPAKVQMSIVDVSVEVRESGVTGASEKLFK